MGHFLAKNHLLKNNVSLHCIASARAKGQGLLGHCPEAKTHFTVSNRDPIQHTTRGQSNFPLFEIVMLLHIYCTSVGGKILLQHIYMPIVIGDSKQISDKAIKGLTLNSSPVNFQPLKVIAFEVMVRVPWFS